MTPEGLAPCSPRPGAAGPGGAEAGAGRPSSALDILPLAALVVESLLLADEHAGRHRVHDAPYSTV